MWEGAGGARQTTPEARALPVPTEPRRLSLAMLALASALLVFTCGCLGPAMQLKHQVQPNCTVAEPAFRDSLSAVVGTAFTPSNRVTRLVNGDEIFPALLKAIRSATNTIHFENYLWRSGPLSDEFIAALGERARAGVEVRIIVDAFGSMDLAERDIERLRSAGARFVLYNPTRLHVLPKMNFRDHRKLLIVDGGVGFTGGVCIADEWIGDAETPGQWRETHFRVEGPAVAQLQGVFAANWLKTEGELLFSPKFFPATAPVGDSLVQAFRSGPQDGREMARLVYLSAIASAKHHIRISQSYFVPDELAMEALLAAVERGVKVEIITPSTIDAGAVRRASRSLWPRLLEAGAHIYEYGPAMYHLKIMIVDDLFVTCGSVNFDERSFRINDESNINVLDPELARRLTADFERDKAQSQHITNRQFRRTSWLMRRYEMFMGLFRSQF
jgi:cardiolipin synthase A/B